ncbi:hypothetical protein GCM10009769_26560 [Curtobacterium luteum]|uniref:Uncharacterized protein n=1 Tax=Curtobacterium luteum TaxID=33881 RepID=A0A8H9GAS2_9MICO|nr:hypothetical protein GCM10009769_26560 [Curtobacterium luteum]
MSELPVPAPHGREVALREVRLGVLDVGRRVREIQGVPLDHDVTDVAGDEEVVQGLRGRGLPDPGSAADEEDLGPCHVVSPGRA